MSVLSTLTAGATHGGKKAGSGAKKGAVGVIKPTFKVASILGITVGYLSSTLLSGGIGLVAFPVYLLVVGYIYQL